MPEAPKNHATPSIVLVTPVWKDSTRLADYGPHLARALADHPRPIRWIIADDGSGPAEGTRLQALRDSFSLIHPAVEVHFADSHLGKGGVIREAWSLAPQADWLAFVDADGAAPPEDVLSVIDASVASGRSTLGIRKRTRTTRLKETLWRGIAHRLFLVAVHLILGLRRASDPQCGLKCIKGEDYRRVAGQLAEIGLAFDSEMLAALSRSGAEWNELPVNWTQVGGGRIHPARDAWPMLASLWKVRKRWRDDKAETRP